MAQLWLFDVTNYPGEIAPELYDPELGAAVLNGCLAEYERADELGFDGIYLAEHHFSAYNLTPSPNVLLAAIAQRTKRLRLGTMCNVLPFTQPLRLAEEFAMIDAISGGRLDVGVGRGVNPIQFERYGIDMADAQPMFIEGVELMRKAWTQSAFTHDGAFYPLHGECSIYPRPVQKPHPPLWITAVSDETIEWAAEHDVAITSGFAPAEDIGEKFRHYTEVSRAAGNNPTAAQLGVFRHVFVAESEEEARALAAPALRHYFHLFGGAEPSTDPDKIAVGYYASSYFGPEPTFDEIRATGFIICGDPASVRDQILEQLRITGAGRLLGQISFGNLPYADVMRALDLLGTEVLPAVHAHDAQLVG